MNNPPNLIDIPAVQEFRAKLHAFCMSLRSLSTWKFVSPEK